MSEAQERIERALEMLREYDKLRTPGVIHTNSGPPFDLACPPPADGGDEAGAEPPRPEGPA